MTAAEILSDLERAGVVVTAVDGRLLLDAPLGAVSPALRLSIIEHKPALIEELELRAYFPDPRPDLAEDHDLWRRLLEWGYGIDGEAPEGLFGVLRGLRSYGARLVATDAGARLTPGEIEGDEYLEMRARWLLGERATYGKQLGAMLRALKAEPPAVSAA